MNFFGSALAGFFSAAVAAMGLGGGGVLIVWLAAMGYPEAARRGINLLFFIPCAAVSLIIHKRSGLLKPSKLILPIVFGLLGAAAGVALGNFWAPKTASKLFGWFLGAVGAKELLGAIKNKKKKS